MKKIFFLLLSLIASHIALADTNIAATIKIINRLQLPMERTGASFGCGSYAQKLASTNEQDHIDCQYQDVSYYDVTLPDMGITPNGSTQSTVIAYPIASKGYGRLGFQYAITGMPLLGCSIIMDFTGDTVSELRIQPLYPNPWINCVNEGTDKDVQLVIKRI